MTFLLFLISKYACKRFEILVKELDGFAKLKLQNRLEGFKKKRGAGTTIINCALLEVVKSLSTMKNVVLDISGL